MKGIITLESGAAVVVAALLMTALIGFSAIVIDYGSVAGYKRQLQNAVDAACLAAAQNLPYGTAAAQDTAERYLAANAPEAQLNSVCFPKAIRKSRLPRQPTWHMKWQGSFRRKREPP
jgi:Flp pilus assembly protein TadG